MHPVLNDTQLNFFADQGFLRLESITTSEDVDRLRESYDRIFAERAGRDEGYQFDLAGTDEDDADATLPQILQPAKYAPEMNDSELLRNATAIAKQLLGSDAECTFAHAIFKPPRTGAETPWHQDAAYWDPNTIHQSISIWVPLQNVDRANGCMEFVPKSHRLDVLTHRSINNDPRIHGLELDPSEMYRTTEAVACPLPAGGCTIHGGYMLHYAGPNLSDVPRRALILGATVPGRPRSEQRSFHWQEAWNTVSGRKRQQKGQSR